MINRCCKFTQKRPKRPYCHFNCWLHPLKGKDENKKIVFLGLFHSFWLWLSPHWPCKLNLIIFLPYLPQNIIFSKIVGWPICLKGKDGNKKVVFLGWFHSFWLWLSPNWPCKLNLIIFLPYLPQNIIFSKIVGWPIFIKPTVIFQLCPKPIIGM